MDLYNNDLDNDVIEDDLEIFELIEVGVPRQINIRINYFDTLDELAFFRRFRLTKPTVLHLLPQLEGALEFAYDINNCLPPLEQLLIALRFFATGSQLLVIADFGKVHISTCSRIVKRVSLAIAGLRGRYIKMPRTEVQIRAAQRAFHEIAAFPRVIGAVDGTHVKIQSAGGDDAEIFRNRKNYYSLNIQAVSSADTKFIDLVARWPGSAHDSTIFNHSRLRMEFEAREYGNSFLLGDSGYMNRPYLLTPLLHPQTPADQLYNESQIRSRNPVERLFGIWKRRFPCMAYGIRLKLETTLAVIVATAILHNIAKDMGEEEPPVPEDMDANELQAMIENGNIDNNNNQANINRQDPTRQLLIDTYFARML